MMARSEVKEIPLGSNSDNGGFIDSSNAFFGLKFAAWCASGLSKILRDAGVPNPVNSARALSFAKNGKIHTMLDVQLDRYLPKPGDIVVWDYGAGKGHVDQVMSYEYGSGVWILKGFNRSHGTNPWKGTTVKAILGGAKCIREIEYGIECLASFYHNSLHGNRTSNGEIYHMDSLTAAHKTMEFGTRLRVTNMRNGKAVIVRINDRGPFIKGRELDLSRAAAEQIGMIRSGVIKVKYEVLSNAK
jgi:rare lipoprotein A (RlpA)-like double-psi beta-barrel protein